MPKLTLRRRSVEASTEDNCSSIVAMNVHPTKDPQTYFGLRMHTSPWPSFTTSSPRESGLVTKQQFYHLTKVFCPIHAFATCSGFNLSEASWRFNRTLFLDQGEVFQHCIHIPQTHVASQARSCRSAFSPSLCRPNYPLNRHSVGRLPL
jgi:hypothetical protein